MYVACRCGAVDSSRSHPDFARQLFQGADHFVTALKQAEREVASDETGGAGDENFHAFRAGALDGAVYSARMMET